jgi:hypothetical protein
VGLIEVVVGVLAEYDGFDGVEWGVAGPGGCLSLYIRMEELGCKPGIDIFHWREDFLARIKFFFEKALELEEFFAGDFVLELGQPAFMQSVNFEFQQVFLLVGEFGEPFLLVKFYLWRLNCLSGSSCDFI